MTTRNVLVQNRQKAMFWMLVGSALCFVFLYIFFVQIAVARTVERGHIEEKIVEARSSTSKLEAQYLALTSEITHDLALSMGYTDAAYTTFVPKKSVSTVLSVRTVR